MAYKYLLNEDKIVDIEPQCRFNRYHEYVQFIYNGKEDGRVELCDHCGLIRLIMEGFYSGEAFRTFMLKQYPELEKCSMEIKIKNEMAKRESIQIFGD